MAKTVIDELIVTLGLDASDFDAERKRAAQSLIDTRSTIESSVESMGASLMSFTTKLGAFFLGFEGLRGVIDLVKDTAFEFKQLSITAELLGTSLREVRTLQEVSELAGAPKGALGDFVEQYRMQWGRMLLGGMPTQFLPALVGITNFTGFARMDPQAQLNLLARQTRAHAPELMRFFPGAPNPTVAGAEFLQMMGIAPQAAAAMMDPAKWAAYQRQAAATNRGITDRTGDAATRTANSLIDLRYKAENLATLGFEPLMLATNLLEEAMDHLRKIIDEIVNGPVGKLIEGITQAPAAIKNAYTPSGIRDAFSHPAVKSNVAQQQNDVLSEWFSDIADWFKEPIKGTPAQQQNAVISNWFSTLFGGIAGLLSSKQPSFIVPIPMPNIPAPNIPALQFHGAAAASVPPTASLLGPGGQSNSYDIGSISINTKATDAAGIAAAMSREIARKFDVTQADSGMLS